MFKYEDLLDQIEGRTTEQPGTEAPDFGGLFDRITPAHLKEFGAAGLATSVLAALVAARLSRGNAKMISSNVIDITCVVTDDLPVSVRNAYCYSLQIMYAHLVRSILNTNTSDQFSSSAKGVMRSIPILTKYDKLKKTGDVLSSAMFAINKVTGDNATAVFNESVEEYMEREYQRAVQAGIEAYGDALVKEGRKAAPTFVQANMNVFVGFDKRNNQKQLEIGISVRPKVVTRSDIMTFFVNKNSTIIEANQSSKISLQNMIKKVKSLKNLFSRENKEEIGGLTSMMEKIEGIKKPFVAMCISQNVADELEDEYNIKITDTYFRNLCQKYPVLSLGIYNVNSDTVKVALTPDASLVVRSAAEFNSETDAYERKLSESLTRTSYY